MVKIELLKDFNVIVETLTRIGIANNKDRKLYQSCHILQKRGEYYIVHFKELLKLDGRRVDISEEDVDRRDDIVDLLERWGLCERLEDDANRDNRNDNFFRVIGYKEKHNWDLIPKYQIGTKK